MKLIEYLRFWILDFSLVFEFWFWILHTRLGSYNKNKTLFEQTPSKMGPRNPRGLFKKGPVQNILEILVPTMSADSDLKTNTAEFRDQTKLKPHYHWALGPRTDV